MMEQQPGRAQEVDLWDKIWRDERDNVVIFQMPNVWIVGWAVLAIASIVVSRGSLQTVLWWASTVVLGIWSLLEIFQGVNYFRRALGVVVLIIVVAMAFGIGR